MAERVSRRRIAAFAGVAVLAAGIGIGYAVHAAGREAGRRHRPLPPDARLDPSTLAGGPRIVFRATGLDASYGRVAMVSLADPAGPRAVTGLNCDRVDVVGQTGLCLTADRGIVTTYEAYLFDRNLRRTHTFTVTGAPSRARLSPDARLAAVTVFVTGHAYAGPAFSTATTLYDVRGRKGLGNLESFAIYRDGKRIHPADANFWGVTFATDDDTFYATLATGGTTYLVRGSLRGRAVRTLTTNVECPSLSPDGTRIAFKERVDPGSAAVRWRASVLDVGTMTRTMLAETRSVDDQIAWFDNRTVAYGLPRPAPDAAVTDTWVVPAAGGGKPRVLVPEAWSPAVVPAAPTR